MRPSCFRKEPVKAQARTGERPLPAAPNSGAPTDLTSTSAGDSRRDKSPTKRRGFDRPVFGTVGQNRVADRRKEREIRLERNTGKTAQEGPKFHAERHIAVEPVKDPVLIDKVVPGPGVPEPPEDRNHQYRRADQKYEDACYQEPPCPPADRGDEDGQAEEQIAVRFGRARGPPQREMTDIVALAQENPSQVASPVIERDQQERHRPGLAEVLSPGRCQRIETTAVINAVPCDVKPGDLVSERPGSTGRESARRRNSVDGN